MMFLAPHAADGYFCVLAIVICWFPAEEAESLLAFVTWSFLVDLLDLTDQILKHKRDILLSFSPFFLNFGQFGEFLREEPRVDSHQKGRNRPLG